MMTNKPIALLVLCGLMGACLMLPGCEAEPDVQEPEILMPSPGMTWSVDFESGTWTSPENVDLALAMFTGEYPFFMGVSAVSGQEMDLVLAIATEDGQDQDMCNRTVIMPGVSFFGDRTLQFGPLDFIIANGITTENMLLTGELDETFTQLTSVAISGQVVLSTIPPDMLEMGEDQTHCELLELLEIPCTPCRDGTVDCVDLAIEGVSALVADGVSLQSLDVADCHDACELSADNPDCDL